MKAIRVTAEVAIKHNLISNAALFICLFVTMRARCRTIVAVVTCFALFLFLLLLLQMKMAGESTPSLQALPYREDLFRLVEDSPFKGFDNETGTPSGEYIVPNIVHFLFLNETNLSYVTAVCVLAALRNQQPDRILFHTDAGGFEGPHWERVKSVVEVHRIVRPTHVFGKALAHVWHAGDVARIRILMAHGGVFLDNDTYLVRSLDCYRKFEMALGRDEHGFIGTQTLVAHKDARFLKLWLETYRQYRPELWYYNAGQKPMLEVLAHRPDLVHSEPRLFGVHDVSEQLYQRHTWPEWRLYHTLHLLIRHRYYLDSWWNNFRWPQLDETSIGHYPMVFGEMAREVYPP